MKKILPTVLWICIYLLLVLAPLLVLMLSKVPPGSGFWWDFSMALGFSGMAIFGVLFLLTARFRRMSAPFGIDIIYYFHRYLAIFAVVLIFSHYLVIRINNPGALGVLNPLQAPWYLTSGRIAILLFTLIVLMSLLRKRLGIQYDRWRVLHIVLAVSAFLLALGHIEGVGYYIDAPAKHWLWNGYTLSWLLLILYVRLFKPWRIYRRPYRVAEVRQEHGHSWTLALDPVGHEAMRFKPGQFAWLSLRYSPWRIKEHPFSISSSAEVHDRLEFTIKELGDFTRTVKNSQVGDIAYLDGPFGIFSIDEYPDAPGYIFIAGGVGVAPIISMLRTLADRHDPRPLYFIYANNCWQDVIFREELETLKQRLDLRLLHVLKEPHTECESEPGLITGALLQKTLPKNAQQFEYFLCGPRPMSDAVQRDLRNLQVPASQVHFELFDLV